MSETVSRAAVKLYKGFTELPFDEIIPGEIPQPRKLEALGPIKHVVYISNKWVDSEGRRGTKREWMRYIHDFNHNPPTLCFDKANRHHHIIGKVLVAPEGVKDFRGKGAGNKTDGHTKYDIPKQMTFLGYLDEIVYESVEDGQDYKVEYKDGTALCANPSGLKLFIARMKKKPKGKVGQEERNNPSKRRYGHKLMAKRDEMCRNCNLWKEFPCPPCIIIPGLYQIVQRKIHADKLAYRRCKRKKAVASD